MRISELAELAAVNVQTVRYYERRGLVAPVRRRPSGFRVYDAEAVRRIRFIRHVQALGFTLREIGELLVLGSDSAQSCHDVEERARDTLARLDQRIRDLRRMRRRLDRYVSACSRRPALEPCPLLELLDDRREPGDDRVTH